MKLKIGNIEISDISLEELDTLVGRYGGSGAARSDQPDVPAKTIQPDSTGHAAPDAVILRKLVDAPDGMPINDVGALLGRRGKAARSAIQQWAVRVRLVQDSNLEAIEYPRVGSKRNARLKPEFRDLAKEILQRGTNGN
jgi:hypothetical protein